MTFFNKTYAVTSYAKVVLVGNYRSGKMSLWNIIFGMPYNKDETSSDMRDVFNFLVEYVRFNNVTEFIIAPIFHNFQMYPNIEVFDKIKGIHKEISKFLKNCNIRKNSRNGVKLNVENNIEVLE